VKLDPKVENEMNIDLYERRKILLRNNKREIPFSVLPPIDKPIVQ